MRCLGNGTGFVRQVLWGAAVIGLTTSLRGAVADVSWFAMMLRFAPGDGRDADGHTVTLVLDTQPPSTPVSGLLTLDASNGAAWRAFGFYLITSPQVPVPRFDDVRVDLPMTDANADGVPDLLEIGQGLSIAHTGGIFEIQGQTGVVGANWERAAGSALGRCVFTFTSYPPFPASTFTNEFTITTLNGTLIYETGATHTTGVVNVARSIQPSSNETGTGAFSFTRDNADTLSLPAGALNFTANPALGYRVDSQFKRAGSHYRGIVTCTNGSPGTLDDRFRSWLWGITVTADRDQNGIPDFSDVAPAFPPELQLDLVAGQLALTVNGESGATYTLQSAMTLDVTGWVGGVPVALATNRVVVFPGGATVPCRFWRAIYP